MTMIKMTALILYQRDIFVMIPFLILSINVMINVELVMNQRLIPIIPIVILVKKDIFF